MKGILSCFFTCADWQALQCVLTDELSSVHFGHAQSDALLLSALDDSDEMGAKAGAGFMAAEGMWE
jgi:hypothetical protein